MTEFPQDRIHHDASIRIILRAEDRQWPRGNGARVNGPLRGMRVNTVDRHGQAECRPVTLFAADNDITTHCVCDALHKRKAETRPPIAPGNFGAALGEWAE